MANKKWVLVLIAAVLLTTVVSTAIGEGYWDYSTGRSGVNIYVKAHFYAYQPVSTTDYGLKLDKHVKKVRVVLVEGDYSEKKTSSTASSKTDRKKYEVSIYHFNNPLVASSASKTWYYF